MEQQEGKFRIIIIGGDHYNTYGIVRSLGEEGVSSHVIILGCKSRDSFVLRSKFIKQGFGCLSNEEAISFLKNHYKDGAKNIVICCSDEAEELVISYYETLSPQFILPVCAIPQETSRLMNKDSITKLANNYGISTPKTWIVINRHLPEDICFPCITKPITSTKGHKSDIVICHDKNELIQIVDDETRCSDFLVQEFIDSKNEISILGAVLANGEVVLSGCIKKLRTCMIGTTSFGVMVENTLLGETLLNLREMMSQTSYRGLFSAEFLIKEDKLYFLEVNFRNDGNTYVSTATGLNLPLLYINSFMGNKLQKRNTSIFPCFFMLDIEDFLALKRNQLSFRQWRSDYKKANIFLVYNKSDIKPFRKKVKRTIASTLKRAWNKYGIHK